MKKILIVVALVLVVIQFIRPEKNVSGENTFAIQTKYEVPVEVDQVLEAACYDCHSNQTRYPWYAEVQPVAWWLANHVNEGKGEVNYSEFTNRPLAWQNHKLEETIEMVKEGEMPLPSYTWFGLHADANLTDAQRLLITNWAQQQMDYLKATYPADSLVRKRRDAPEEKPQEPES